MSNQDNTSSKESNHVNSDSSNTNLNEAQYMSELNTYNTNYAEWIEKKK